MRKSIPHTIDDLIIVAEETLSRIEESSNKAQDPYVKIEKKETIVKETPGVSQERMWLKNASEDHEED